MNKKDLREKYKFKRKQLTLDEIEELSLAVANTVLKLDIWKKTYFHLFLSIAEQKEINTDYLLHLLSGKDKEIIISKSDFETKKMTHFLLTDNTRVKINKHHIPEPVDGIEVPSNKIDVVFVPLLAFDRKGHRVGYGAGFYDNFLSECRADVVKVGLSFFEPEEHIDGIFENDVKLNFCVSPNAIYKF